MGKWSEEEYLFGWAKHRLDIDPNDQSDLWGSSCDRDVCHKCTRKMRTQKYLRESCYHCIECSVANSLAALMRKWSLNNTFLALQPPPKTSKRGWWDKYQQKPSTVHV